VGRLGTREELGPPVRASRQEPVPAECAVHRFAAGPGNAASARLFGSGRGLSPAQAAGNDFYDTHTGLWYDITTAKQWARHVAKYGLGGSRLPIETG
jgi:hypothetical protein